MSDVDIAEELLSGVSGKGETVTVCAFEEPIEDDEMLAWVELDNRVLGRLVPNVVVWAETVTIPRDVKDTVVASVV